MLKPHEQRMVTRLEELITEGRRLEKLERPSSTGTFSYIQGDDATAVHAWIVRVENAIETGFGPSGPHARHLKQIIPEHGPTHVRRDHEVRPITGLMIGALDDLKGGFLANQELLIAGEILDSVMEQARAFLKEGNKDVAAILARVVLEDALKRLAETCGIEPDQKASKLNDELKAATRYAQPRWRQIQAWLDIGNAAAHGKFAEYEAADVHSFHDGLSAFLAAELH